MRARRRMPFLWGPRTLRRAGMLAALLFALGLGSGTARIPTTQAAPALAIQGTLAADGTLDLPPDFRGNLDASGWQSVGGAGEPPRLAPLATADDDKWASNFTLEGVSGPVRALARPLTGQIIVGGSFTAAGNVAARNIAVWNGVSWSALGYGLDGEVEALAASGNNIYAGGLFYNICNDATCTTKTAVNHIAVWNGSSWSGLGSGVHGAVYALVASGSNVYVGGFFDRTCATSACSSGTTVNNIALWNGSGWLPLGYGVDSSVYALALYSTKLYVGGDFPHYCGEITCGLGLAVVVRYIAQWDTVATSWSGVGSGMYDAVRALDVDSFGAVYAGGDFWSVCSPGCGPPVMVNHVAKYSGSNWSPVGVGVHGSVYSLNVDASNNVFVGGVFTFICPAIPNCSVATTGPAAYHVAKWTAATSSWGAMAGGVHSEEKPLLQVNALLDAGAGSIYVGGEFETAGNISAKHVARWTGAGWDHLAPPSGDGMSNKVYAIAGDGSGNVYVGGAFDAAGGVVAHGIARWNGSSWSALGFGLSAPVHALAFDGSGNLYAGGEFYQICGNATCDSGNTTARYVAKWNGSAWSALGNGLNNLVYALAWGSDNALYAGGAFTQACDATCGPTSPRANAVAKWGPSNWSGVGLGLQGTVYALKFTQSGKLYAGGSFIFACDDLPCVTTTRKFNRIAQWDTTWNPLLSGVNNTVYALALDGSGNLFVGGEFGFLCNNADCLAPTTQVNHLAKWSVGAWGLVGNGVNDTVRALAVDSTNALYVGGDFLHTCSGPACAASTQVNHIAKRNVSAGTWVALGSGTDAAVNALAIDQRNYLDVGGDFTQAGGKISLFFGRYDLGRMFLPLVMR